jgi:hypothetical protein
MAVGDRELGLEVGVLTADAAVVCEERVEASA